MKQTWVVDASAVAKVFFSELLTAEAEFFFQKAKQESWQLLSPNLIDFEIGNICWKRIIRKELLEYEATEVMISFKKFHIKRISVSEFLDEILILATNVGITFYDASYLYLAIQLESRLLTADEKLLNKLGSEYQKHVAHLSNL